jgi:hypothetical protein
MGKEMTQDPKNYTLINEEVPYKSYIKRILGMLYVTILNPFNETEITGLILKGNPRGKNIETCIIDVFSPKQDKFLRTVNKRHFGAGRLIEYTRPVVDETKKEKTIAEFTEEELLMLLKQPYAKLQKEVNKIELPAILATLVNLAVENDKSTKTVSLLESKLSELQQEQYTTPKET